MNSSMNIVLRFNISGFRDRLESARKDKKISYDKLAEISRLTGSTTWNTLTGKTTSTTIETLLAIADALEIDLRNEILEAVKEKIAK